jgi:hypothetical protein
MEQTQALIQARALLANSFLARFLCVYQTTQEVHDARAIAQNRVKQAQRVEATLSQVQDVHWCNFAGSRKN